jgi:putative phosphoribosyl transferase
MQCRSFREATELARHASRASNYLGGDDLLVIVLNRAALARLNAPKALEIVPGASHLFAEPGALEAVVDHARHWLKRYLRHAQEPTSQS